MVVVVAAAVVFVAVGAAQAVKNPLTGRGANGHVNGRERVGVGKGNHGKAGLVGERDANVVERPQHEPETVVVGNKGVSEQQASNRNQVRSIERRYNGRSKEESQQMTTTNLRGVSTCSAAAAAAAHAVGVGGLWSI